MRKKEILAKAMRCTGMGTLAGFLRHLAVSDLPILAYHRVYDVVDESSFPFDPELVSATPTEFAWQMQYVKDRHSPITFQMLIDSMDGRVVLPPRPVIVTFDDGYDDNYHHAFPVLKALNIPATIFISTGYVGSDKPFWFDLIAHILYRARPGVMRFDDLGLVVHLREDVASRRTASDNLLVAIKSLGNERRLEFLSRLEKEYGAVVDRSSLRHSHPLNWEQIREMSLHGIEFGSHTVSHPILSSLDGPSLDSELAESMAHLERELGKPVSVLAYPVGGAEAFNANVISSAKAAGYRLGVSYIPGVNLLNRLDHFRLRRQHVERYTSRAYFTGLLGLPEIFR